MKRKGLLCILLLLLFFAGITLINSHYSAVPSAQSSFSSRPLTIAQADITPHGQDKVPLPDQTHPTLALADLLLLLLASLAVSLLTSILDSRRLVNALALPIIALLLGLSNLVLRE